MKIGDYLVMGEHDRKRPSTLDNTHKSSADIICTGVFVSLAADGTATPYTGAGPCFGVATMTDSGGFYQKGDPVNVLRAGRVHIRATELRALPENATVVESSPLTAIVDIAEVAS